MAAPSDVPRADGQAIEAEATAAGCRVVRRSTLNDGVETWPVVELECGDNDNAIAFLNRIATADAGRPEVRDLALRLRAGRSHARGIAEAIHAFVKASVAFVRETRETFQHALYTLRRRAGDCDDHARLVAALGRAAGLRAYVIGVANAKGRVAHVATLLAPGGHATWTAPSGATEPGKGDAAWRWAETTIDARFGEHPHAAAKRLGILHRPDIWDQRRRT